jgi:hypothetical protein
VRSTFWANFFTISSGRPVRQSHVLAMLCTKKSIHIASLFLTDFHISRCIYYKVNKFSSYIVVFVRKGFLAFSTHLIWVGIFSCGFTKSKMFTLDRCYIWFFQIFSPKNLAKILAFFAQTTPSFLQKMIMTLVFEKSANFFRRKLAKIAENCDHNIDPCLEKNGIISGHIHDSSTLNLWRNFLVYPFYRTVLKASIFIFKI